MILKSVQRIGSGYSGKSTKYRIADFLMIPDSGRLDKLQNQSLILGSQST